MEVADLVRDGEFKVFAGPARNPRGRVAALRIPGGGAIPRSRIDGYTEFVGQYGAKGPRLDSGERHEGGPRRPPVPHRQVLDDAAVAGIVERTGAEDGDLIFFGADDARVVNDSLGALRRRLAGDQGSWSSDGWQALWVVEFPMFEWDGREKRWSPLHHPFTAPTTEDPETLRFAPGDCLSKAYDLVVNGHELGGGSVRIHRPEMQQAAFRVLGIGEEEAEGEVRLPARVARVRVPAPRRDRIRPRPHRDAARGGGFHPGRHRVSQDPDRPLPSDRRPHRRRPRPASRARDPRPHPAHYLGRRRSPRTDGLIPQEVQVQASRTRVRGTPRWRLAKSVSTGI